MKSKKNKPKPALYSPFDSLSFHIGGGDSSYIVGNEFGFIDSNDIDCPWSFDDFSKIIDRNKLVKKSEELFLEEGMLEFVVTEHLRDLYYVINECPYCRFNLIEEKSICPSPDQEYNWFVKLLRCPNCAWWYLDHSLRIDDSVGEGCAVGRLRRFSDKLPKSCSAELAQYIRAKHKLLHNISPKDLELLVADIFRANRNSVEVVHIGKPGDRGVDILYIDEGGKDWLVQVKSHRSGEYIEPFSTIQSVAGSMMINDINHAIIVSSAQRFSIPAKNTVSELINKGFMIKLIDKGKLIRMIGQVLPKDPWQSVLDDALTWVNPINYPDDEFFRENVSAMEQAFLTVKYDFGKISQNSKNDRLEFWKTF